MNKKYAILLIISICMFIINSESSATHIRAGEIIATRISMSDFTYRFSIIGYTDSGVAISFGDGQIDFGDGTAINIQENPNLFTSKVVIDFENETTFTVFEIEHTFQLSGTYIVSYNENNRNSGVINMENSVDTPFHIETRIVVNSSLSTNSTPIFLVPPVDQGGVGLRFIHNPGAFDIDGDSLSYKLVIPRQSQIQNVDKYVDPNDSKFYSNNFSTGNENKNAPPIFEINSITGDLIWDAPGTVGEYNVAFIVEEWRFVLGQWINLGCVTRDMQIIINDTDNNRPKIIIPDPLCVEAGTFISEYITGTDQDGDQVRFDVFGSPFALTINPATFTPKTEFYNQPLQGHLEWQTECVHVRKGPYEVLFRAMDNPPSGSKLADIKRLPITIYAPAPTGLVTTIQPSRSIKLEWDEYNCGTAERMQVWRKVDSYNYTAEDCELGIRENSGYELIASIDSLKYLDSSGIFKYRTSYLDDNIGDGLAPGANYCYRLVATFPEPAGGKSVVSEEVCDIILPDAPIILNIDVLQTHETDGEILVNWLEPFEINQTKYPPLYTYEVFRYEGLTGNNNEVKVATTTDTELIDVGLNTSDLVYNYRIDLFINSGSTYVDSSAPASSVELRLQAGVNSINLVWDAQVPWSNHIQDYPFHYIYRDKADSDNSDILVLIDSAEVTMEGLQYLDEGNFMEIGLDKTNDYCYYVETKGSYGNLQITRPLLNKSQIICSRLKDLIPPCVPISFKINGGLECEDLIKDKGCFFNDFYNELTWELDASDECATDIAGFNIYYSLSKDGPYEVFETDHENNEFHHDGLSSFKGFYKVSSVDWSGNESGLSEEIQFDNCPNIEMPNVFTPNNDGVNDVFTPFVDAINGISVPDFDLSMCPRFVESIEFKVFDRNGGVIYNYNSDKESDTVNRNLINWNGKANSGIELPSGVYYYIAEVTFDVLDQSKSNQILNGWVQILK